jgi:photosystem II stability/assembly factor-like uncharacterized protein
MLQRLTARIRALPITALALSASVSITSHDAIAQRRPAKPVSAPLTNSRMKGIWESVSYNQDLELTSVYFVTPRVGWVSGQGGTILKTVDAGAHWTAQLGGDPAGAASTIRDLRFVDQRHGFAVQSTGTGDHSLLRTVDGQTWRASGTVPQHRGDYRFTTPTVGFTSTSNEIRRTRDAGRSWQKVMDCATSINVNGLSRNVLCGMESLSFPTPQIGYAAGGAPGGIKGVFLAKTTDGGNTWAIWRVLEEESVHQGYIVFTDANTGFLCTYGGKFFSTADGGRTWDGVAGVFCGGGHDARFADPQTGWTLESRRWNYTTDGGRTWGSRELTFPAGVNGFSLPRRDRGYAVGDHGMVYRYSIVPASYSAPNSMDAPVVGAFDSPLDDQVEEFVSEVEAFSTENGGPSGGPSGGMGASGSDGSASGSNGSDTNSSGGGSASGGNASDASAGGAGLDAGAGSAAPGSKGKRRGNRLGKLQALLDAIGSTMPDFLGRYRNLNLLFEGARTAAGMPSWLQTVKGGLAAFRSSTDKSSAAAALAQLVSAADSLKNQTRVAFMQSSFTSGSDDAGSASSSTPATPSASASAPAAAVVVDSTKSAVADSIANAAKEAAKKKLGGLLKNPFGKH